MFNTSNQKITAIENVEKTLSGADFLNPEKTDVIASYRTLYDDASDSLNQVCKQKATYVSKIDNSRADIQTQINNLKKVPVVAFYQSFVDSAIKNITSLPLTAFETLKNTDFCGNAQNAISRFNEKLKPILNNYA